MMPNENETDRIPTNLRCLLILEVLGRSDRSMTATEINASLGLPKQSIHRLCATLEEEGFITRLGQSMKYHAARRLRELGTGLLTHSRLHIVRHQILERVARAVGETVNLAVPEHDGMSYIDRVETDWPFRIQLPVGSRVPFHCTASGKTFLASLSSTRRKTLVSSLDLTVETDRTLSTPEALLKEVGEVEKQGFALDQEELFPGMVAIAVPFYDPAGKFVGAISFHGPTQRISIDYAKSQLPTLQEASAQLTDALFAD